jgi:hypothetical protein
MAIGQGVLGGEALDVAELRRLGDAMETREQRRAADHAAQLADALAVRRVYAAAGMPLSAAAHVALLLSCSESRAQHLLHEAQVLRDLGALGAMADGFLTVEQGRVVVDLLGPVDDDLTASLWERLAVRLEADRAQGVVRAPARLRELLDRWLLAADPEAAAARRRDAAEADADVELWKRGDGLTDLVGRALSAADAIACSDRLDLLAQPVGPDDDRTSGQRRQAALVDLLLGRTALPFDQATTCCSPGSPSPCGAQIFVHVPLATAVGDDAELAALVGHGPVDAALLADLLACSPILRRVWVDPVSGVPVAVDDQVWTPGRDQDALALVLAEMRTGWASKRQPVHPDDHPPDGHQQPPQGTSSLPGPRVVIRPHLTDPGGYVPPRRPKALLRVRAPRCEWTGCGRSASRATGTPCDLDHDLAWPFGPTCACNLGPLCRRHHRIKQKGWAKRRQPDGSVRWTDPTGRGWTSPSQHPRPLPPCRQVAAGVWALAA